MQARVADLEVRIAQLDGFGADEESDHGGGAGGEDASKPGSANAEAEKPRGGLHHLLNASSAPPVPFVSKRSLQQAVEGIREDVRRWLEAIQANMLAALDQKADQSDLDAATMQAANVAGASLAAFAKRTFVGRCASCDAPTQADLDLVRRPTNTGGCQDQWSSIGSPGAKTAIRPPSEGQRNASADRPDRDKLPKLQEPRASRDFPKGRVLRAASASDLRRAAMSPSSSMRIDSP